MDLTNSQNAGFIVGPIRELQSFQDLLKYSESRNITTAYGIEDTAATVVLAALRKDSGKPFIILMDNDLQAQHTCEDLLSLGVNAKLLPSEEISFLRADASSKEISVQRLTVLGDFLSGKAEVLIVPASAAMQRLLPAHKYSDAVIAIHSGDIISPEKLIGTLVASGYERVDVVEAKGQCSLRGGILDLFPIGMPNALRIEFFDDEIDSMREFDVLTQRSIVTLKEAVVYPAGEVLLSSDEAELVADRLDAMMAEDDKSTLDRQRSIEQEYDLLPFEQFFELADKNDKAEDDTELPSMFELGSKAKTSQKKKPQHKAPSNSLERHFMNVSDALRTGRYIDNPSSLTNVLYEDSCSIFSYIPDAVVVVISPSRIRERCAAALSDFLLSFSAAFERGEALKIQSEMLVPYDALLTEIKAHKVITVDSFLRSDPDYKANALVKFESLSTVGFGGNLKELEFEIKRLREKKSYTVLLSGGVARGQRLAKAFSDDDLIIPFMENCPQSLTRGLPVILPFNLSGGFSFPEAELMVFSENDIFGKGKQHKRAATKTGDKIAVFTELRVGDYVVHESHGVGQYMGTVRLQVENSYRDFLHIRYGGTDKLYVPTDQMDRVQKYIGSDGEQPKLNRLSGGEWQKQKAKVKRAIRELAFDLIKLYAERSSAPGFPFSPDTPWQHEFEDAFPFEETPDQENAIAEIKSDMERPQVMDRLLCGDVGYGKTEVALRAVFKCIMDSKQAVLLAPTTILVQQHYATALNRFKDFPIKIDTLSRFKTPQEQKRVIQKLKTGEIDFVIGTHKLLAKDIEFKDLGLLVVDEEQRFGVGHKETIKQYKKSVDVLTLSATPIPRTLHMSMVGIRDMSVLKTPPQERLPVQTYVVEYSDGLVRDAILRELSRGGQVYVLHNRVQSIEMMYGRLKKLVPEARICIGHGQMREQQLEDVMIDFYEGKFDVLLCTTIIEAGLDVPRANTLIVYDADRFGLSQLYQLRGRVGRSNRIAYAYLTVNPNKVLSPDAEKRLNAIREFTEFGSGFRVAMRDLEIRGTGTLMGAEQSGHLETVGYDLYIKMIDETVREIQGTGSKIPVQTRVDIQIDAFLPVDYVATDSLRIEMYKKIAEIHDEASRDDVIDELIDRYGEPGKPVMNLIYIALIKAACQRLGIENISYRNGVLVMRFSNDASHDWQRFIDVVPKNKKFKFNSKPVPVLQYVDPNKAIDQLVQDCTAALNEVSDYVFSKE